MVSNEYYTTASAGYLGATRTDGSKSHKYLYGGELSKTIKKSLQNELCKQYGLKKSQIRTRIHTYSMGQTVYVTIKLDDSFRVDRLTHNRKVFEILFNNPYFAKNFFSDHMSIPDDLEGLCTQMFFVTENLNMLDDLERARMIIYNANLRYKRLSCANWAYGNVDDAADFYAEKAIQLIKDARQIINAYRYNDSNGMVDYFDTNFYYDLDICFENESEVF